MIGISTYFLTKLSVYAYNHGDSKNQDDIDFYGNFDLYRILLSQFIAFTVFQSGRL